MNQSEEKFLNGKEYKKKNNFVEVSKSLARYICEQNLVVSSK